MLTGTTTSMEPDSISMMCSSGVVTAECVDGRDISTRTLPQPVSLLQYPAVATAAAAAAIS